MTTEPKYPKQVRGMNGYECDQTMHDILHRLDPDFLKRRAALMAELGAFALGEMDAQAEESDRSFPPK